MKGSTDMTALRNNFFGFTFGWWHNQRFGMPEFGA